ncbi:MAG TPA: alpha/beta hydrolase [Verrucomicrobiae bacterium]|nr:alpha/beta hydrolase [Verrucomicrobiae bacterium]
MKTWHGVAAVVGAAMIGFGAWAIHVTTMPRHTIYVDAGGCKTPITVIDPDIDKPVGSAVVLHGLSANRRVMNYLGDELAFDAGLRIYALDLAGHGDNEAKFTFRRAQDCAAAVVANLIATRAIDPKDAVYIGHSMGASIAIRLADVQPLAGTVAISPGPTVLPKRMPANLLVFTGQFDPRLLKRAAQDIETAAGGDRTGVDDFMQQRAFLLDYVPWATHSSQLHNQQVEEDARDWILNSFEAASGDAEGVVNWKDRASWTEEKAPVTVRGTLQKVWYAAVRNGSQWGVLGLLLVYPLLFALALHFANGRTHEENAMDAATPSSKLVILEGLVFGFGGVLILEVFRPMSFVHLLTGGYLASLMLLVGLFVAVANRKAFRQNFRWDGNLAAASTFLGFAVFLSMGAWLNWEIDDAWMNAPRWLRFFEILPAAWLFFYAEEILLGPVGRGGKRAKRFGLFLIFRLLLLAACVFAVFRFDSGQILILLLIVPIGLLTVLTRWASDSLRLRTASATAAALFGAILAAWFAAAVFPLT